MLDFTERVRDIHHLPLSIGVFYLDPRPELLDSLVAHARNLIRQGAYLAVLEPPSLIRPHARTRSVEETVGGRKVGRKLRIDHVPRMDLVGDRRAHDAHVRRTQSERDALVVRGFRVPLFPSQAGRVLYEPVRHSTCREGLEGGLEKFPPHAKVGGEVLEVLVRFGRVGVQEPKGAFEDVCGAEHAGFSERDGHKGVVDREPRVETLVPASVGEVLHGPRGLGASEPERVEDGLQRETFEDADGRDGAKDARGRCVVEPARVGVVAEFLAQATCDFVSNGDGEEEVVDTRCGAEEFGLGETRGDGGHAGVERAFGVCVVEVEAVAERGVEEARVLWREVLTLP